MPLWGLTVATTREQPTIACRDECGARIPEDRIEHPGWTFLPIQRRYRCPACWRALEQAEALQQPPATSTTTP